MSDPLDLIIVNDDGTYIVSKATWQDPNNKLDPEAVGDGAVLVKRGALVADVPLPDIPCGYYCFLVNLAQLSSAQNQSTGPFNPLAVAPDADSLLVHVLPDEYYSVPFATWHASPAVSAPVQPGEPVICAERPDGFVINLPRIRK